MVEYFPVHSNLKFCLIEVVSMLCKGAILSWCLFDLNIFSGFLFWILSTWLFPRKHLGLHPCSNTPKQSDIFLCWEDPSSNICKFTLVLGPERLICDFSCSWKHREVPSFRVQRQVPNLLVFLFVRGICQFSQLLRLAVC